MVIVLFHLTSQNTDNFPMVLGSACLGWSHSTATLTRSFCGSSATIDLLSHDEAELHNSRHSEEGSGVE